MKYFTGNLLSWRVNKDVTEDNVREWLRHGSHLTSVLLLAGGSVMARPEFWKTSQVSLKGFYALRGRNVRRFDKEIHGSSGIPDTWPSPHIQTSPLNSYPLSPFLQSQRCNYDRANPTRTKCKLIFQKYRKKRMETQLVWFSISHCHSNLHIHSGDL